MIVSFYWLLRSTSFERKVYSFTPLNSDIVDIKPTNMEELTEVITAAEFHPVECNLFVYSSSKGTIRLCDMRAAALCDRHSKCTCWNNCYLSVLKMRVISPVDEKQFTFLFLYRIFIWQQMNENFIIIKCCFTETRSFIMIIFMKKFHFYVQPV